MFSFAVALTFYFTFVTAGLYVIIDALYIIAALLFVVYFYLSYAMAKELPTKNDLNPRWDEARRERFAEKIRKNKERSKKLVYFLVPLLAVIGLDILRRAFGS